MVFGQPAIHMDENIASTEQYIIEQTIQVPRKKQGN